MCVATHTLALNLSSRCNSLRSMFSMQGLMSFLGRISPSESVWTPVGVAGGELVMDIIVPAALSASARLCLNAVSERWMQTVQRLVNGFAFFSTCWIH